MPDPPRYRPDASTCPHIRPGELPGVIGVDSDPPEMLPIGRALGRGRIGSAEEGTLEQTWRLVVRGETLEGRYVLRGGVFVERTEEASGQGGSRDCHIADWSPCGRSPL